MTNVPSTAEGSLERGALFPKKQYQHEPLPAFADARELLPRPILETNPGWLEMYWKCWELAWQHLREPQPGSGLVSNYLDAAFNGNIFQWDTIFMVMFARYGHRAFPAIQSLDNFYARQHTNGFICREILRDGSDFYCAGPVNAINPPLFSWAEAESFRTTGDKSRFAAVLPTLEKYVEWLNTDGDPDGYNDMPDWISRGRRAAGSAHQLYWNTSLGSGMDNAPRSGNGWVDMSCQMVIQYRDLAAICDELNLAEKSERFREEAAAIGGRINRWCWDQDDGFYYDLRNDGSRFKVKTSGGFWPLLAGIASEEQADRLVSHLRCEREFWRPFVFPTLAADEKEYTESGGYWWGAVWAPTNYAIIKGLERCSYEEFATESSAKYLSAMEAVFRATGTVWENYAPELPFRPGNPAMGDFVGWTGIGPIALLIENILGFRCDGARRKLRWNLSRADRHGIENLQLGDAVISIVADAQKAYSDIVSIRIESSHAFHLEVRKGLLIREVAVPAGHSTIQVSIASFSPVDARI